MKQAPPPPSRYSDMPMEPMVKKRNVLAANALGLLLIWIAAIVALGNGDLNVRGLGRFLTITGAVIGVVGSLSGALGSKRTTDMQNLGLLIWSGLLMVFAAVLLTQF